MAAFIIYYVLLALWLPLTWPMLRLRRWARLFALRQSLLKTLKR